MTIEPDAAPAQARAAGGDLPLGYAFAAIGALLFSTKAVIVKLAYGYDVSPETLIALRAAFSLPFYLTIGMFAWHRGRQKNGPVSAALIGKAMLVGVIGVWFASYADFIGLTYISAQFERLILFTYPVFVVLFGALFFNQRIRPRALAALGVSYLGLAAIFTENLAVEGESVVIGAGLVVVAAIAFALYQFMAKDVIARMGPGLFTCIAMTGAGLAAFASFFATQDARGLFVSGPLLGYVILLAVGATVLPSFFMNAALHRISAHANAAIGILGPVATMLLAVAVLGEPLTAIGVLGSALVLAGVGWFTLERDPIHGPGSR
jgi:drug/metabolite transporter (DMT)-like permease